MLIPHYVPSFIPWSKVYTHTIHVAVKGLKPVYDDHCCSQHSSVFGFEFFPSLDVLWLDEEVLTLLCFFLIVRMAIS